MSSSPQGGKAARDARERLALSLDAGAFVDVDARAVHLRRTRDDAVGECLRNLVDLYPELMPQLFDGKGRLQKTVEIYLNMASAYPDELARPTTDGDRIHITLMLAGG